MIQQNENHQLLANFQKAMKIKNESAANLQTKKKEYENIQHKKSALLDIFSLFKTNEIHNTDEKRKLETCYMDDYNGANEKNGKNEQNKLFIVSDSFAVYNIGILPINKENRYITKFYNAKRIFYSVKGNYLTIYTLKTDKNYELTIESENKTYKGNEGWIEFCMAFNNKFELKSIYDFFGLTDVNVKKKIDEMLQ